MDRDLTQERLRRQELLRSKWDPVLATHCLAEGDFVGYIKDAVNKLRPKLPLPLAPYDDFVQEFNIYCIEAIKMYKPELGAQFTTFLYKHFNIRSQQWFNWAWMPKQHEAGKWTYSFGQLQDEEGEGRFDPVGRSNPIFTAQVSELKAHLTARSRQLFDYFGEYLDFEKENGYDNLIPAFSSDDYASKVSSLTTVDKIEIRTFVNEMLTLTSKYVELPK